MVNLTVQDKIQFEVSHSTFSTSELSYILCDILFRKLTTNWMLVALIIPPIAPRLVAVIWYLTLMVTSSKDSIIIILKRILLFLMNFGIFFLGLKLARSQGITLFIVECDSQIVILLASLQPLIIKSRRSIFTKKPILVLISL
jgi:hypothetical protein